jgi:hypothetical protein
MKVTYCADFLCKTEKTTTKHRYKQHKTAGVAFTVRAIPAAKKKYPHESNILR